MAAQQLRRWESQSCGWVWGGDVGPCLGLFSPCSDGEEGAEDNVSVGTDGGRTVLRGGKCRVRGPADRCVDQLPHTLGQSVTDWGVGRALSPWTPPPHWRQCTLCVHHPISPAPFTSCTPGNNCT